MHVSDLHSKTFGENQKKLVRKVSRLNPDLLVFTDDLIDSKKYKKETGLVLMEELTRVAPVYFVTGNYEWWSGKFSTLERKLTDLGVHVLRNEIKTITNGKDYISIIGVDDPAFINENYSSQRIMEEDIEGTIKNLEGDRFSILLSHKPEMLPLYNRYGFDLVFSGHAHGGQFRLPIVGGVVALNQGFFRSTQMVSMR